MKDCLPSKKGFEWSYVIWKNDLWKNDIWKRYLKEWLVEVILHLERKIERIIRREKKNFKNSVPTKYLNGWLMKGFWKHSNLFTFFTDLKNFCDNSFSDLLNLVNLLTLRPSSVDINEMFNISTNSKILSNKSPNLSTSKKLKESSNQRLSEKLNSATTCNNRYEGEFVSANIINLSSCHLSKEEVSLLSKGLKFVPTSNHLNKAKIIEEIEAYFTKLRLTWHFQNDHQEFNVNPFKKISKCNTKGNPAIEIHLSRLEK